MRIDKLSLANFRYFDQRDFTFHPEFNLIVGVNGTGKSSILDALSISLATWLLGFKSKLDVRGIEPGDARLATLKRDGTWKFDGSQKHDGRVRRIGNDGKPHLEAQYPVAINAIGMIDGNQVAWSRTKESETGVTRYGESKALIAKAEEADLLIRLGKIQTLPLIAYYGTMRLWQEPKKLLGESRIDGPEALMDKATLSRLDGYRHSVDPRISVKNLIGWFARQEWVRFQSGAENIALNIVRDAAVNCIEGAESLYFDPELGQLMVAIRNRGSYPFANLSDGQRGMLAMVVDIAQKAEKLNSHLGDKFLIDTPGVVLIDELDLHLHPRWQRRITDDLRRTFPKIQFICTTHSPQLIGQAKANEIILLDKPEKHPGQSYGMDSNWILRHVMDSNDRDPVVAGKLDAIFEDIENGQFDSAQKKLNAVRTEVGEHPDLVEAEALISRYTRFDHPTAE
jgi:predicted ATP-binding protein involved in virulence